VTFTVVDCFHSTLIVVISKITYFKGVELLSFGLASLHLEDDINSFLYIGPEIGFDFRENEHLIDKDLECTKSGKECLFLFTQIVVLSIFGIHSNLLKMLWRLHLHYDDVIPQGHSLKGRLSNLLEKGEILLFVVQGAPGMFVAVDTELNLYQELHNINFIEINLCTTFLKLSHPQHWNLAIY
jgi:hypothetical protein